MSNVDNVILVGPMGAGKTTLGRLLAAELRLPFVDSDQEVERRCGADIPWIFDMEGESGFRDRESAVLEELLQRGGVVLATGGGVVERSQNRALLSRGGVVVYLNTPLSQQFQRTARDRKRPLLQSGDRLQVLESLMARRDPWYREVADVVVSTEQRSARALLRVVLRSLQAQRAERMRG